MSTVSDLKDVAILGGVAVGGYLIYRALSGAGNLINEFNPARNAEIIIQNAKDAARADELRRGTIAHVANVQTLVSSRGLSVDEALAALDALPKSVLVGGKDVPITSYSLFSSPSGFTPGLAFSGFAVGAPQYSAPYQFWTQAGYFK